MIRASEVFDRLRTMKGGEDRGDFRILKVPKIGVIEAKVYNHDGIIHATF